MTLIEVRNSEGLVARCDAKCHNATAPECDCVCGGRYHGKRSGSRDLAEQVRADGYAFMAQLASEGARALGTPGGGQVAAGAADLLVLPLPFGPTPDGPRRER